MNPITYTPVDHIAGMRADLIDQFRGLPNLDGFIQVLGAQLNDIDQAVGQLVVGLALQNAIGAQLDGIGLMLQQSRNGLNDNDYRTLLQARINFRRSNGTIEDLIQIMLTIAGAQQVQLIEEAASPNWFPQIALTASAIQAAVSLTDIFAAAFQAKGDGIGLALAVTSAQLPVFQFDKALSANNAGLDQGHLAGLI